jgi:hypothetical protein
MDNGTPAFAFNKLMNRIVQINKNEIEQTDLALRNLANSLY